MSVLFLVPSMRKDKMEQLLRSLASIKYYPDMFILAQGYTDLNISQNKNVTVKYVEYKANKNVMCNIYYNMYQIFKSESEGNRVGNRVGNRAFDCLMLCDDDFIFYEGVEDTIDRAVTLLDSDKDAALISFNNLNQRIRYRYLPDNYRTTNRFYRLEARDTFRVRKNGGILIRSNLLMQVAENFESGEEVEKATSIFYAGYDVYCANINIHHDYSLDGFQRLNDIYDNSKYYVAAVLLKSGLVTIDKAKREYTFASLPNIEIKKEES